jgi:hypothetical protein
MSKTLMILDVAARKVHFAFAPEVAFKFVGDERSELQVHTVSLQDKVEGEIVTGDLTTREKHVLLRLVEGYPDVFTSRLGLTRLIKYDIQVKDPKPVRLAPYRLSPPKVKFLREHIQSLLQQGIIETSVSPYSSPMFLVPKQGGSYRAVVDYRALNKCIEIESVPLPDIHSAFHWFAKAKYFTTLDLNQAYYQIPLAETSKRYTAFCTD